jgi:hypothetical protein
MSKYDESFWNKTATDYLVGRTILKVEWMSNEECEELGWYSRPLAILLDNGVWIYPMRDDEGNDGGAFGTSGSMGTIPVLQTEMENENA